MTDKIRHLSCGCPDCKGHAINADYREMWQEAIRLNQRLCAALSETTGTPTKRVPLTPEEINQIVRDVHAVVPLPYDIKFARAIEAAHGIHHD